MTNSIKKFGGEIRTKQYVKRILVEGDTKKKAVGVELENGEKIFANRIISNADPSKTYLDMVGTNHLSSKLVSKLNNTTYSCTSLMLFLIVDMDVRKAGLDSGNIWMMPDRDTEVLYNEIMNPDITSGDDFAGLFVSCTTLKDPTSFDGKYHAIEAITYINHEAFNQFKNEGEKRSKEYLDFKKLLTEKMIKSVEKIIPRIREKIVHHKLGTPVTNDFFINSTNGCVYGTEKKLKQIGPFAFQTKSEIENLYLCGASILSHGVAGASYSGVQTAAMILNCKHDTQNVRVYDAENDVDYPDWMLNKIKAKRNRSIIKTNN